MGDGDQGLGLEGSVTDASDKPGTLAPHYAVTERSKKVYDL